MSSSHTDVSPRKIAFIFWPLLVIIIILASEIAVICTLNFPPLRGIVLSAQGWPPFPIVAPVAGLVIGLPSWQRYVMRAQSASVKRGILVGCLCSIVAHPIMWISIYGGSLLNQIFILQLNPHTFSGLIIFIISEFSGLIIFIISATVTSLLYAGWITAIVGGIAGALLIYLQSALTREIEPRKKNVL